MAPILSLAVKHLPASYDATDLDFFVKESLPESNIRLWPLVNEYDSDGTTVIGRCGTLAIKPKGSDKKLDHTSILKKLNDRYVHSQSGPSRASFDRDFLTVVPLYEHPEGAEVDIYVLHGLGGHAFYTWCNLKQDHLTDICHWPRDLLPQELQRHRVRARVSTIGYNANVMRRADQTATLENLADSLLSELKLQKLDTRKPFYFICHSLGGLILCQSLILAMYSDPSDPKSRIKRPQYRDVFMNGNECLLKGIEFLGTPFNGSLIASQVKILVDAVTMLNPYPTNAGLVEALTNGNPDLADIVGKFHNIQLEMCIRLWIGCESRPKTLGLVTTRSSAEARFGDRATVVTMTNEDHTSMVRYDHPSNNFDKIARGVINMIKADLRRDGPRQEDEVEVLDSSYPEPTSGMLGRQGRSPTWADGDRGGNALHRATQSMSSTSLDRRNRRTTVATTDPGVANSKSLSQPREGEKLVALPAEEIDDTSDLSKLAKCDTVFVIDDTNSMELPANRETSEYDINQGQRPEDRWSVLEKCMSAIVNTAASADPDGIDVRFLKCGQEKFRDRTLDASHISEGQDLLDRLVEIRKFLGTPKCQGGTEFYELLYSLLSPNTDKWKAFREAREAGQQADLPGRLNIIVVTDGMANDSDEVEWAIEEAARALDTYRAPPRVTGIQFVQIGDDTEATQWLRYLDDDLKKNKDIRDMVDTKPWDPDNIHAILLGAIMVGKDNQH